MALPGGIRLVDETHQSRDLGSSREGERLDTAFEFVSDGEGPLVIDSIETGCGCAVTGIELHGEGRERTPPDLGVLAALSACIPHGSVGDLHKGH